MNHSNNKMMWWMMAGCLLPVVLILVLGGTGISKNWIWLGAIVLMFGMHAMMMSGHKHSNDDEKKKEDQQDVKTVTTPDSHEHN